MAKTIVATKPANLDEHQAELASILKDAEANHERLLECCDPTVAKYHEDRKPLYEWRVQVKLFRAATGRKHAHRESFDKEVVAQTAQDAWAMFCDSIEEWPDFRNAKPEITRLRKRTLKDTEPERT
jgi:hypothetical protein